MRVLLVEDEGMSAPTAVAELTDAGAAEVTLVRDPGEALIRLDHERYDVAVVDLLYQAESDRFEKRRREGRVQLTDARLLRTGLAPTSLGDSW